MGSVWLSLFLLLATLLVGHTAQNESAVTIVCYYGTGNSRVDWTNITCHGSCTKAMVKYENVVTIQRGCVTYVWDSEECVQSAVIDTTTCYCNHNLCNTAYPRKHAGILILFAALIQFLIK